MAIDLNIPTDSLYKTMAISGVILFFIGYVGWIGSLYYYSQEDYRANVESLTSDIIIKTLDGFESSDKNLQLMIGVAERSAEAATHRIYVENYLKPYATIAAFSCLTVGFSGLLLAITGFTLWYRKLQWYIDKQYLSLFSKKNGSKDAKDNHYKEHGHKG